MTLPTNAGIALLLTLVAGLSTGIGGAIAFFIRKPKTVYLSISLGLSAGVMIFTSFVKLLPHAFFHLGELWALTAFFVGMAFMAAIDLAVPKGENPHDFKVPGETNSCGSQKLLRAGLFTALAIGIHNFPEGLATFGASLEDLRLGVAITLAIAIHNIPEGISVSVPIFCATGDRMKAFAYTALSGLAEPLGAVIGLLVLMPFLTVGLLAALLGFVAGIMIYISLDELLPLAHGYGHGHASIAGVGLGMAIAAAGLLVL